MSISIGEVSNDIGIWCEVCQHSFKDNASDRLYCASPKKCWYNSEFKHKEEDCESTLKNKKEMINHPSHYNQGKFEAIDVIEDWQLNFNLCNTVKYISRAGHKDDIVQDLKKALWYLDREIKRIEKE